MAQNVPLATGDPAVEAFFDATQEMLSGLAVNLVLELADAITVRVPAGLGHDQVSLSIGGQYRAVAAPLMRAHPGGLAGTYDVYATSPNNDPLTGAPPGGDLAFALAITPTGQAPVGVDRYRLLGRLQWDGATITAVEQTTPGPNPAALIAEHDADALAHPTMRVVRDAPIDPLWPEFGARADMATDDAAALNAAINAAEAATRGVAQVLLRNHRIAAPLTINSPVDLVGVGRDAARIASAVADLLVIGTLDTYVSNWSIRNLTLHSEVGGGHIVQVPGSTSGSGCSMASITNFKMLQDNAARCYWDQAGGAFLDMLIADGELRHVAGATVPGWRLIGPSGFFNVSTWHKLRITHSGEYVFHVEATNNTGWHTDLAFRDINFEVTVGGNIKAIGAHNLIVDNCSSWDITGVTTRDLYWLGASAAALNCRRCSIRDSYRRASGGLGAGLHDIRLDNALDTLIDNVGRVGGASPLALYLLGDQRMQMDRIDGDAVLTGAAGSRQVREGLQSDNSMGRKAGSAFVLGESPVGKVKAGVPADADYVFPPPDGTLQIDSTNNRLYVRIGGVWRSVGVA